jgi:hypothetical protein
MYPSSLVTKKIYISQLYLELEDITEAEDSGGITKLKPSKLYVSSCSFLLSCENIGKINKLKIIINTISFILLIDSYIPSSRRFLL